MLRSVGWQRAGHDSVTEHSSNFALRSNEISKEWMIRKRHLRPFSGGIRTARATLGCEGTGAQGKGQGPTQTSSPPHRKLRDIRIRADGENSHPAPYKMKESKLPRLH